MVPQEVQLPSHHQIVLDRFVTACQSDERVLAACLVGSYARGTADAFSDLDLFLFTTDDGYDDFRAGREAFIRQLGEPIFLEDFGTATYLLFILADGTEVELGTWPKSQAQTLFSEPCRVLLDRQHLLTGLVTPAREAARPLRTRAEALAAARPVGLAGAHLHRRRRGRELGGAVRADRADALRRRRGC